eukprot:3987396-Heterocapsa_arctica.AAC.1
MGVWARPAVAGSGQPSRQPAAVRRATRRWPRKTRRNVPDAGSAFEWSVRGQPEREGPPTRLGLRSRRLHDGSQLGKEEGAQGVRERPFDR